MVSPKRHWAKSFTWRVIASITTALIAYFVSGVVFELPNSLEFGAMVGGLDIIIKLVLYYIHERAWYKSKFGINENVERES